MRKIAEFVAQIARPMSLRKAASDKVRTIRGRLC